MKYVYSRNKYIDAEYLMVGPRLVGLSLGLLVVVIAIFPAQQASFFLSSLNVITPSLQKLTFQPI